jgi:hypothetical protein
MQCVAVTAGAAGPCAMMEDQMSPGIVIAECQSRVRAGYK